MAIHLDTVVYIDPTDSGDVLSAEAASKDGARYGTIAVTHGAVFDDSGCDQRGMTQSVCVRPGDELAVLAVLGDRLRGITAHDSPDRTLVGTVGLLRELAAGFGLTQDQVADLIDCFTTAPAQDH